MSELRAAVEAEPEDLDKRYVLAKELLGQGAHRAAIDECIEVRWGHDRLARTSCCRAPCSRPRMPCGCGASVAQIVKRDASWNEEAARKTLLKIFEVLGNAHDLTKYGRRLLAKHLF